MLHTPHRAYRSLSGLQTGSTSRVLNLAGVAHEYEGDAAYRSEPFFSAVTLNSAVIVKHRLRNDEAGIFECGKRIATKVIIPFERSDLGLGGRSLFVGQRGWLSLLEQLRGCEWDSERDITLLEALDELPSLDPFLLREHLRRRDFKIAECYFAISRGEIDRMQSFVAGEISRLVELAYGGGGGGASISKLVGALLSGDDDGRLEPLRLTLGIQADDFRESIFSWKGFLYYKWQLASLWPDVRAVLTELNQVKVSGRDDRHKSGRVSDLGRCVNQGIVDQVKQIRGTLAIYDQAFDQLTKAGNPGAFRDFLVNAPNMFVSLGERTGIVSHIASFWRYRFPKGAGRWVDVDELTEILSDFYQCLGIGTDSEAIPNLRPLETFS